MIYRLIGSFIAAIGFGYIYQIKGNKWFFCSLSGVLGALVYEVSILFVKDVFALLLATTAISIYAEFIARIFKMPVTGPILLGLIILVPGGGMYYTMLYVTTKEFSLALSTGIDTLTKAGCLALGPIIVSSFKKIFGY